MYFTFLSALYPGRLEAEPLLCPDPNTPPSSPTRSPASVSTQSASSSPASLFLPLPSVSPTHNRTRWSFATLFSLLVALLTLSLFCSHLTLFNAASSKPTAESLLLLLSLFLLVSHARTIRAFVQHPPDDVRSVMHHAASALFLSLSLLSLLSALSTTSSFTAASTLYLTTPLALLSTFLTATGRPPPLLSAVCTPLPFVFLVLLSSTSPVLPGLGSLLFAVLCLAAFLTTSRKQWNETSLAAATGVACMALSLSFCTKQDVRAAFAVGAVCTAGVLCALVVYVCHVVSHRNAHVLTLPVAFGAVSPVALVVEMVCGGKGPGVVSLVAAVAQGGVAVAVARVLARVVEAAEGDVDKMGCGYGLGLGLGLGGGRFQDVRK